MLGVVARLDHRVDQGPLHVVDVEPGGVLGPDDELVLAGLGGQDRPPPDDREFLGVELLGRGGLDAEVEPDHRVDPVDHPVAWRRSGATCNTRPRSPRRSSRPPAAEASRSGRPPSCDTGGPSAATVRAGRACCGPARSWNRRRRRCKRRPSGRPPRRRSRGRPRASSARSAASTGPASGRPRAARGYSLEPSPAAPWHETHWPIDLLAGPLLAGGGRPAIIARTRQYPSRADSTTERGRVAGRHR